MTSKIVTLKDNTGTDNLYPITPVDAVFVDSNTTLSDELNDKASTDMSNVDNTSITSSKIDWSTYQGSTSMPWKSSSFNAGIATLNTSRIGNICFCSGSFVTSSWAQGNRVDTGKTIPAGFTPVRDTIIIASPVDGSNTSQNFSFTVKSSDSKILRSAPVAITVGTRFDYLGVWATTDAWPS